MNINDTIQWKYTCVLYNDHLMSTFVHIIEVTNLDPLNSTIYVNILGTQT